MSDCVGYCITFGLFFVLGDWDVEEKDYSSWIDQFGIDGFDQ